MNINNADKYRKAAKKENPDPIASKNEDTSEKESTPLSSSSSPMKKRDQKSQDKKHKTSAASMQVRKKKTLQNSASQKSSIGAMKGFYEDGYKQFQESQKGIDSIFMFKRHCVYYPLPMYTPQGRQRCAISDYSGSNEEAEKQKAWNGGESLSESMTFSNSTSSKISTEGKVFKNEQEGKISSEEIGKTETLPEQGLPYNYMTPAKTEKEFDNDV